MRVLLIGTNHYLPTWGLKKRLKKFQPDAVFLELPKNTNEELINDFKLLVGEEFMKAIKFCKKSEINYYYIGKYNKNINEHYAKLNNNLTLKLANLEIIIIRLVYYLLIPFTIISHTFKKIFKKDKESTEEIKKRLSEKLMERDKHMFKKIKKYSKGKRRIAVVTGATHLINLKKWLEKEGHEVKTKVYGISYH